MKSIFNHCRPETFGLVVVGATLGAVLGSQAALPYAGAAAGAALLPASVAIRWSRLIRRPGRNTASTSKLA